MLNSHNDPQVEEWLQRFQEEHQVEQWFRRFDAALPGLPAEERTVQRQEIQQHLEALAAAHQELGSPPAEAWRLALKQFGNPTKIGRKIYQEWQQVRTGSQADIQAIVYATMLLSNQYFALTMCNSLWSLWLLHHGIMPTGFFPLPFAAWLIVGIGGTILVGVTIGRNRPLQAIKAAFYSGLLTACFLGFILILTIKIEFPKTYSGMIAHLLFLTSVWMLSQTAIAYLASVTKRGWYRPSWADFTLTLPRKQRKLSR